MLKKIIVTGGYGFIGSNLINYLISKNFYVINIDKITYAANPHNLSNINKKKYLFVKSDLNNKKKIKEILIKHKPIGIFNLAAETHVDRSIDAPNEFINSNILGVFNLLEALRHYIKRVKKKIKLIHISTDEVYGDILLHRSNEDYPYKPSSPYSASKAAADHLVKSYVRTYGISAIITNCSNNYGPRQFPEKLIPKMIFNILNNKSLPIYGKGHNSREWIYVEDHCNALLKVFLKGKLGETYNIGSGFNVKNIDIAKRLLKIVKNKNIKIGKNVKLKFVKDRPGHDIRYALDSKKIFTKLGWKSKTNINSGLLRTFNWYNNNKKYYLKIDKKKISKRFGLKND